MLAARVIVEPELVANRLHELFGVSADALSGVAKRAAAARADATDNDPINAPGTLAYIMGTRALRDLFLGLGWVSSRMDGVEAVYSDARARKIVFQNAERAADPDHDPEAISPKGSASERAVRQGQYELFPTLAENVQPEADAAVWYLFVYSERYGGDIRAELSCPRQIDGRRFVGFHERIIVVRKGDLDPPLVDPRTADDAADYRVAVSRK